MTKNVIIAGDKVSNIPWQNRPERNNEAVWRHQGNPIINRNPVGSVARIFNSAVVPYKNKFAGVFRAEYKTGKPHLHKGFSEDGLKWEVDSDPIVWKDTNGKEYQPNYAYDPRVVKVDDIYFVIWCTDFFGASIGLGMTEDFKTFTRLENPFLPFNRNGVLFPRKVNGKYMMLSRPSDSGHTPFGDIFISESPDLIHWGKHRRVMAKGGDGWWQAVKIGGGPAPIETPEGWLTIYHGVTGTCNGYVYSMGAALLDKDDPSNVLYRTKDYLLTPEELYETNGFVPNVVFPCATLHDADTGRIAIYYGAADTFTALAYTTVDLLMKQLKTNSELVVGDNGSGR